MTVDGKSFGRGGWPPDGALVCLGRGTASGLSSVGRADSWYRELIPYLIWVSYASYLNAGIFWLNR